MSTDENKKIVQRAVDDVFNKGDLSAIDEIYGQEYGAHERDFATLIRKVFPDLRLAVEQQVAEDDLVCTHWRATGTQQAPFMGIPAQGTHAEGQGPGRSASPTDASSKAKTGATGTPPDS